MRALARSASDLNPIISRLAPTFTEDPMLGLKPNIWTPMQQRPMEKTLRRKSLEGEEANIAIRDGDSTTNCDNEFNVSPELGMDIKAPGVQKPWVANTANRTSCSTEPGCPKDAQH